MLQSTSLKHLHHTWKFYRVPIHGRRTQVHLWDVTTASVVADYGKIDFAVKQRSLFRPVSVPSWFTCETSSGAQG